ncbi:MAG TPA: DinB family protein, partial [Luteitalea sp.]|nr:DinB family protein [Luteitalea sp.]
MRAAVLTLAIIVSCVCPSSAEPLSDQDRRQVLAHFAMTDSWLASEVAGLSAAQQAWRPSPNAWNVTDVVEHLAVAEEQYWKQLQASLTQPLGQKTAVGDERILWYGIDRTERATTGDARVPTGRYSRTADALAVFARQRDAMRTFTQDTREDLRGRLLKDSRMDVYQWLLMISSHAQR